MLSKQQKSQNQQRHYLRIAIRFFTYVLGFTLAAIAFWVTSNFGQASLEQVLYHAQFGMEGLVTTDVGIVRSFILTCLVLPIALRCCCCLLNIQLPCM